MRTLRAGASRLPAQIQVVRTGGGEAIRPAAIAPAPRDVILIGDCVAEMDKLPAGSVDLVFADPPYNLQLEGALSRPDQSVVDGVDDDWDKFADFAEYDAFTRAWLAAARRAMKPNATIVVIGSYHNIFRVGAILQDLGFWILNDIVWLKANPMPNFRGRRFTNAHETMIWAARGPEAKRYTFNYEALKAGNDDCQARSDWFLPICTGAERLKDAGGRKTHPTQKPEALLQRPDDRRLQRRRSRPRPVLRLRDDRRRGAPAAPLVHRHRARSGLRRGRAAPDCGGRTAGGRRGRDRPRRGAASRASPLRAWSSPASCSPARSCATPAGAIRRWCAPMEPSPPGPAIGSIHKIGALIQGLPACNGWTFWHVERAGRLKVIDELRSDVRASLRQAAE